ncbi:MULTISPECIES: FadR/GntR family transcriptional regulator [unclassified Actinoplanes]|uniref:FadR/GntR family transcriptional regulator n=1 Tax=unclassified Actinoplanes TaxID=2626549 RepID=UPI001E4C348F|nr:MULTISPECIES: FCD domain-containing protein [unclassified Actinoplanes]
MVVDECIHRIATGEWKEGAVLPTEAELCKLFGFGRSAVREALQALAAKGFVTLRQGSRSTVAPRSDWNQLDAEYLAMRHDGDLLRYLAEAREVVEPAIAALAADRASPAELRRLGELAGESAQLNGADPSRHAEADMAFHEALAHATGNPILVSIHASITGLGRRSGMRTAVMPGAVDRAFAWHRHVVDTVAGGDSPAAADATCTYVRQIGAEPGPTGRVDRIGFAADVPRQISGGAACPGTR